MKTLISTLKNGKPEFFALLTKRMNEKGDFPALTQSAQSLEESIHNEDSNISEITNAVLGDFTLTQKVIKLANSAMYSGMSGEITTITQAAIVLGLDAVAHLALSIRFIDTLSSSAPDSEDAREELSKAIMAGEIARNIVGKSNLKNGEEAVVCTLMHHLGRLLLVFYFPEEWAKIKKITEDDMSRENEAALQVIGVSIDEIAQQIAKSWRLPNKISHSMGSSVSFDNACIPGSEGWLKAMANFAGEAASKLNKKDSKEDLKELVSRYSEALLVSSEDINESIHLAHDKIGKNASEPKSEERLGKPGDAQERLVAGVDEFNKMLVKGLDFNSALSMVLETMYASMGFNRVSAFFHDAGMFKAKVGFGNRMPEVLPQLKFTDIYAADVFHLSLNNKADVFIQEKASFKSSSSMPSWFKEALPDVGAFVLLPLVFNDRAVGLIYADWKTGGAGLVEPVELSSMGALRDRLVEALGKKHDADLL